MVLTESPRVAAVEHRSIDALIREARRLRRQRRMLLTMLTILAIGLSVLSIGGGGVPDARLPNLEVSKPDRSLPPLFAPRGTGPQVLYLAPSTVPGGFELFEASGGISRGVRQVQAARPGYERFKPGFDSTAAGRGRSSSSTFPGGTNSLSSLPAIRGFGTSSATIRWPSIAAETTCS